MRIPLSIFSLLLTSLLFSQVYEAPVLKCMEVAGDDVNLFWDAPADPTAEFHAYRIFTYEPNGDFSQLLIEYNAIGQVTHSDLATLVDDEVGIYFIEAVYLTSVGEIAVSSDTISSIDLGLLVSNQTTAFLDWNSPFLVDGLTPDSLLPDIDYQVEMFFDGAWQLLGTTPWGEEEFEYVVEVCHGLDPSINISFRVRVLTDDFCGMVSTIRSGDFKDENPPSPPLIETVTVDTANNKATICWYPSPEMDTGGYIVLNAEEEFVGTTSGIDNTTLQNPASLASVFVEGYLIIAEDTCLHAVGDTILPNRSSAVESVPHFTILPDLEFLKCERAVRIDWNKYTNWPAGVSHYEIYGSLIDTPMQLLGSVDSDTDRFLHENVEVNVDYCYVIKAVSNDLRKPSLSAKVCILTNYPAVPDFTYLANVSVVSDVQVELRATIDMMASGSVYEFQKLDRFGEEFETFSTVSQYSALPGGQIITYDNGATAGSKIQSYRILGVDSCGIQYAVSDTSYNILLEVFVDDDERTNTLNWQHYRRWAGDIGEYRIYRALDGVYTPFPYAVVDASRSYFVDELDSDFDYENSSTACYYVEAVEVNDPYGVDQISRSNEECASQTPLFFVPNAIVINGLNPVFRPIAGYVDRDRYLMQVFDRSGTLMFETADYDEGWDATDGSEYVQEGIYVYRIQFFDGNGREFARDGFLTVLIGAME